MTVAVLLDLDMAKIPFHQLPIVSKQFHLVACGPCLRTAEKS